MLLPLKLISISVVAIVAEADYFVKLILLFILFSASKRGKKLYTFDALFYCNSRSVQIKHGNES